MSRKCLLAFLSQPSSLFIWLIVCCEQKIGGTNGGKFKKIEKKQQRLQYIKLFSQICARKQQEMSHTTPEEQQPEIKLKNKMKTYQNHQK